MSSANLISIIISTYNRCDLLEQTIDSILKIIDKSPAYELLIIDNNSTDSTSTVVNKFLPHPVVKYFMEPNQGLSHARNRGMKEAKGDVFVFLDDDIDIEPNYFTICRKLFYDDKVDIVGGKVLPYNANVPDWLPLKYYYMASIFDMGDAKIQVKKLMGANYAMTQQAAHKIGYYNPELGRKGNQLTGGEEVDYLNRAIALGYKVLYDPQLIVYHKIANKLNEAYILSQTYNTGVADSIMEQQHNKIKAALKLLKCSFNYLRSFLHSEKTVVDQPYFLSRINRQYALGYLKSIRLLNKQ